MCNNESFSSRLPLWIDAVSIFSTESFCWSISISLSFESNSIWSLFLIWPSSYKAAWVSDKSRWYFSTIFVYFSLSYKIIIQPSYCPIRILKCCPEMDQNYESLWNCLFCKPNFRIFSKYDFFRYYSFPKYSDTSIEHPIFFFPIFNTKTLIFAHASKINRYKINKS